MEVPPPADITEVSGWIKPDASKGQFAFVSCFVGLPEEVVFEWHVKKTDTVSKLQSLVLVTHLKPVSKTCSTTMTSPGAHRFAS